MFEGAAALGAGRLRRMDARCLKALFVGRRYGDGTAQTLFVDDLRARRGL